MIWETLEWVVEYQAMDDPDMGREARAGWLANYRVTIDIVIILFIR